MEWLSLTKSARWIQTTKETSCVGNCKWKIRKKKDAAQIIMNALQGASQVEGAMSCSEALERRSLFPASPTH